MYVMLIINASCVPGTENAVFSAVPFNSAVYILSTFPWLEVYREKWLLECLFALCPLWPPILVIFQS